MNNQEKDKIHDTAASSNEQPYASIGKRVTEHAAFMGWTPEEDEGAFEFFQRLTYEAGADAKSEQARKRCPRGCEGHFTGCSGCDGSGYVPESPTAAGAGSAQPRAEGDDRALDINDDGHFAALLGNMHPVSNQCVIDFVNTWARDEVEQACAALDQSAQAATTESASGDIPAILFDGHAVYWEVMANNPNTPRPTADNVANVLDAVVRLMRRAALARAPLPAQYPVAAQFKMPGETWEECSIDEEEVMLRHGYKFRYLYAAPAQPVDDARASIAISTQGVRLPDGSFITPEGDVTGPLAEVMAEKIRAAMRANDSAAEGGNAS